MVKIVIDGVTIFLPDGKVPEEKIRGLIARGGEGLSILWLHDLDCKDVSAIFTEDQMVTHTWGLKFSGYGAVIPKGAKVVETEKETKTESGGGFQIEGPVGFCGANALLWGENAVIDPGGVLEFTVRHKGGFDLARRLDSGLKFSFDYEFASELEAYRQGFVFTVTNHVIRVEMPLALRVVLEPARNQLHVYLPENQVFESSLIGISGRTIPLISRSDAGWTLAEAAAHRYHTDFFHTRYYLTLAGDFAPKFAGEDKTILPGLTGTEYFDLANLADPVITLAPGFPSHFGKLNTKSAIPTSANICYPTGVRYYSQPADAPLFAPGESGGLELLSVPLLTMDGKSAVAQMFYQELEDLPSEELENVVYARRFETLCQNINTTRRRNLAMTRAVTPQGLMVGVQDGAWAFLSLANVGTPSSEKLLRIENIDLPLRKSFADVNMNLIFEKPEELSKYVGPGSAFALSLEGAWTVDMNPASWNDTSMLIIKYGAGTTIRKLAAGKKAFLHALSKTVDADGRNAAEFAPFLELIDDPEYTGILALGLAFTADENQLAAGVKTVWSGIEEQDRKAMRAHHLVIRHAKISQKDGRLSQKAASVDAVVYYRADKGISFGEDYNAKDYDFRTTALTLDFKNSRLQTMTTGSELLINQIADSVCQKEGGNCLFFDGRADNQSGLDGFAFALRGEGLFTLSSPLEAVRITTASLAGESVFSLGGKLYFAHDKQSDLFSFGFDGESDCGLNFTGWKIRITPQGEFAAEYGDISLLQSMPRENSWAERFPIGVDSFCHDSMRTPDKCGYVNMKTTLSQKKIRTPWYGVRFRVPLGSLGDLSEGGPLDLYVIAAWSGGDAPGLFIGLQGSFLNGIDVQGLIKLGFDTIALESSLDSARMRYRLSLNQFTARLLWASFPPGKNRIVIEADESGKKLGWLGRYDGGEGSIDGDR